MGGSDSLSNSQARKRATHPATHPIFAAGCGGHAGDLQTERQQTKRVRPLLSTPLSNLPVIRTLRLESPSAQKQRNRGRPRFSLFTNQFSRFGLLHQPGSPRFSRRTPRGSDARVERLLRHERHLVVSF